tara:strand:+ start:1161 stop:1457 length:297 start_codon:yes stop_codon:yes gene_type:complete
MKKIKKYIYKIGQPFIIIYSSLNILLIASVFTMGLWNLLLKPGYMDQRASMLYNYPLEQIFVLVLMFVICFFPIIVVLSLLVILKKIINLEKIILNDK